jgi:hypothetical protein
MANARHAGQGGPWLWPTAIVLGLWIGLTASVGAAEPSASDLSAITRAAKGKFKPVAQSQLDQAKARAKAAAGKLAERLTNAGEAGAGWREFLNLDRVQAELAKPKPDAAVLEKGFSRAASGNEGLNLVRFADYRQTLKSYLAAVQAKDDPKTAERYDAILEGLAKRLADLAKTPSAVDASAVNNALRWLDDTGLASDVVSAVRKRFSSPNAFAHISAGLVAVGIERPIDEMTPIQDVILGTNVQGTGHTVGRVTVSLVPCDEVAVIDTYFSANVDTQSVGYNGPAVINSVGCTRLQGIKRLWIHDQGISAYPAVSDADTQTTVTGIGSTSGRAIVERVASRRVGEQKGQAEAIAAQHAEARLNERMDRESADSLARANERYATRFRDPLTERNLFPAELKYSSSEHWVAARALESDAYHLAAPDAPPAPITNVDFSVRIHQSALNNLTDKAVGGMTVRDETFQATLKDLLGHVPEQFKPDQQDQPWAINFAADLPITFDFLDNQIRIVVRGRRYVRGDSSYPAMDVSVLYNLVKVGNTVKAVRQGGLQIFPPDFVPGKGDRLSGRQLVIRDLIARRFGKVFKEELVGTGMELPGNWKKAGRLMPVAMTSKNGWVSIGWNRAPNAPAKQAPAKTAQR